MEGITEDTAVVVVVVAGTEVGTVEVVVEEEED